MAKLTPRQREIAALVQRGMTSQQIAEKLGITRRTVEAHRLNMRGRQSEYAMRQSLEHMIEQMDALTAELARLKRNRRRPM